MVFDLSREILNVRFGRVPSKVPILVALSSLRQA